MCIFRRSAPVAMATPQAVQPRNPDIAQESRLPSKKDLLDPDEVSGVQYGTTAKSDPKNQAQKTGTDALKINLNTGGTGDAGGATGGLNV
tara:strand:- start:363 stop:632 length:270 start_codon:yes stop_codon:yes gene_type:complete